MAENSFDISAGVDRQEADNAVNQTAREIARRIIKQVKASKLKVQVTNMGEAIRVSSKSRDTLQETIALVNAQDYDAPLTFGNYQ